MTLKNFKFVENISSWIVFLTLLLAFAGLVIFSIRGINKDDFEPIYFFIQDVTLKFPSWKKLNILIISCR